jgi:hypothetical protein
LEEGVKDGVEERADLAVEMEVGEVEVLDGGLI